MLEAPLPLSQMRVFLAADARFPHPAQEPEGDVVWMVHQRTTLPLAPALETLLGLQVQSLALFPLFGRGEEGPWLVDTGEYTHPPEIHAFLPDYVQLQARPFPELEVTWEMWVVSGVTVVGRVHWTWEGTTAQVFRWGWAGWLRPLREGAPFEPRTRGAITYLVGSTPVGHALLYMTGGPEGILGPYPALVLRHEAQPGERRTFTWVWTLDQEEEAGFTRARHWAAQPWEAHRARRLLLDAQMPRVRTGQARIDRTLARGRQAAPRYLVRSPRAERPYLVVHRRPEDPRLGSSTAEDVPTFPELWYWVTQYGLPGVQPWVLPLVEALVAVRNRHGEMDGRPALWGPQGQFLAHPLAVDLVWRIHQVWRDDAFLRRVFPALWDLLQAWFSPRHDRDGDGWPEWDHPAQVGLPLVPECSPWHAWSTGLDVRTVESPALLGFLYRACRQMADMARVLEREEAVATAEAWARNLQHLWQAHRGTRLLPGHRDRDTHLSPKGRRLWQGRGEGRFSMEPPLTVDPPSRLVVHLFALTASRSQAQVRITGRDPQGRRVQAHFLPDGFRWYEGRGVATTEAVFQAVDEVELRGLKRRDRVVLRVANLTQKDISLFIPQWAGLVSPEEARRLIGRYLEANGAFWRPGGWSVMPGRHAPEEGKAVSLLWNVLVLEGLMRVEAWELAARMAFHLLEFQSRVLDQEGGFYATFHGETGQGLTAAETITGLPPLGTLLTLAGLQFLPGLRVRFLHPSPLTYPFTVHIWGAVLRRTPEETEVRFPWGERRRFPPDVRGVLSLKQGQLVEG